jgi:hypothetical protein
VRTLGIIEQQLGFAYFAPNCLNVLLNRSETAKSLRFLSPVARKMVCIRNSNLGSFRVQACLFLDL